MPEAVEGAAAGVVALDAVGAAAAGAATGSGGAACGAGAVPGADAAVESEALAWGGAAGAVAPVEAFAAVGCAGALLAAVGWAPRASPDSELTPIVSSMAARLRREAGAPRCAKPSSR